MTETKLYKHVTSGGAVYLTTVEHDLSTAVVRLDGEPVLIEKYVQYGDIIEKFEEALAELDARYQDGTIAPREEIEQLERVAKQIHGYASSMSNDNGWREANGK